MSATKYTHTHTQGWSAFDWKAVL